MRVESESASVHESLQLEWLTKFLYIHVKSCDQDRKFPGSHKCHFEIDYMFDSCEGAFALMKSIHTLEI
jgi:hypothetical protein